MNYPEWLSISNITWETLDPAFREYFLRRVGYDINKNCELLPDTPESEKAVREWLYGKNLDSHIWCAKGFHQARGVLVGDNMDMWNDSRYFLLTVWLAKAIYEMGIDNNWWDHTITQEEFCEQYEWADVI
jgi:hypothetical protein